MVKKKGNKKKDTKIINRVARKLNEDFNSGKQVKNKECLKPINLLDIDKKLSGSRSIEKELSKRDSLREELSQVELVKKESSEKHLSSEEELDKDINSSDEQSITVATLDDNNQTFFDKHDSEDKLYESCPHEGVDVQSESNDKKSLIRPRQQSCGLLSSLTYYSHFMCNHLYFSTQVCWVFFNNLCLYRDNRFFHSLLLKNSFSKRFSGIVNYISLPCWLNKIRTPNLDLLWKTYSNLSNKKVKLLLNNKEQKRHSGEIVIYVSNIMFKRVLNPISIDYQAVLESYRPLYPQHQIYRSQKIDEKENKFESHNLHIYWNATSDRFGFMFDGLDVDVLKIMSI